MKNNLIQFPELLDRTLFSRTLFVFISQVAPKVTSALIFVLLVRRYSPAMGGLFSLSSAYLMSLVLFSSLGIDELVTREIAKDDFHTSGYYKNLFLTRGILAAVGYFIFATVIWVFFDYKTGERFVILVHGLAVFPESLKALAFSVFGAWGNMENMVIVNVSVSVFNIIFGILALHLEVDLVVIVFILIFGSSIGMFISIFLISNHFGFWKTHEAWALLSWRPDWSFIKRQIQLSLPFAFLIAVYSLDSNVNMFLLSKWCDMQQVGVYSSARNIVLLLSLIPSSMRIVLYPRLSRASVDSNSTLKRVYRHSWFYIITIGFLVVLISVLFSGFFISLLYGQGTAEVQVVFFLLDVHLLANFMYIPSTRLMVVKDQQTRLTYFLVVSICINFMIGIYAIPRFGSVGTAISRSLSSLFYFFLVEIHVRRHFV